MAITACPLMRPRCERNPKMATAQSRTKGRIHISDFRERAKSQLRTAAGSYIGLDASIREILRNLYNSYEPAIC